MKARIVVPDVIRDLLAELPGRERDAIIEKLEYLEHFPEMYPLRGRGPFRRHRCFRAINWHVYYRVIGKTVYIRAIWPARLPIR